MRVALAIVFVVLARGLDKSEGTESYFVSPHGLGKTQEVQNALDSILTHMKIADTAYEVNGSKFTMSSFSLGLVYNDAKQTVNILVQDQVQVKDGRVEFTYRFNFTRSSANGSVKGTAYGSVLSDGLMYIKSLIPNEDGFIEWEILGKGFTNLNISTKMRLKRVDPSTAQDVAGLESMLDEAVTSITPSNIKTQLLTTFNQIFFFALNDTLNHEVFGSNIDYSFPSATHGEMKMTITHHIFDFDVTPLDGYFVVFLTEIKGWTEPICNMTLPSKHFDFTMYGGSQNFHLNCLYESVVAYMQSNSWLDTVLNENWETNAFQFYAGDLFDLINNLHLSAPPLAIVDGQCTASKDGLSLDATREYDTHTYRLDVVYSCTMKTTSKQSTTLPVLKFKANARFYIEGKAETTSLTFRIAFAELISMTFEPVGSFYVTNQNLALFKANQVMKLLWNTNVFGTGFPTLTRSAPRTVLDRDFILYYDVSHVESKSSDL